MLLTSVIIVKLTIYKYIQFLRSLFLSVCLYTHTHIYIYIYIYIYISVSFIESVISVL